MQFENKQSLLKKLENYTYTIKEVSKNPNMEDFKGYHYKITVKNKTTKLKRVFSYSVGLGFKESDRKPKKLFYGLLNSLNLDSIYTDIEEFNGLGYDFKTGYKVYKAILRNNKKVSDLNLDFIFNVESDILEGI
jgi:hypothetical protein